MNEFIYIYVLLYYLIFFILKIVLFYYVLIISKKTNKFTVHHFLYLKHSRLSGRLTLEMIKTTMEINQDQLVSVLKTKRHFAVKIHLKCSLVYVDSERLLFQKPLIISVLLMVNRSFSISGIYWCIVYNHAFCNVMQLVRNAGYCNIKKIKKYLMQAMYLLLYSKVQSHVKLLTISWLARIMLIIKGQL